MTPTAKAPEVPTGTTLRPGPRPLALHLATALTTWLGSLAALPSARLGSMPWSPALEERAAALVPDLAREDLDRLVGAVGGEAVRRLGEMLAGIEAYRRHPYRRALDEPPVVWREGTTRLLDYGATAPEGEGGAVVLFVPSLVNRAYVLDLSERRSLLRDLARRGLRPLLVDWGSPGEAERAFGLDDYIVGRLGAALDRALALAGGPVHLVGYCMGGNLAVALAHRRSAELRSLALLATPWDFHAEGPEQARMLGAAEAVIDGVVEALGELPVDIMQAFFAALDPNLAGRKFRAFARMAADSDAAADFVALEDWINDGVPLAAAAARQCLVGWYGENRPARREWLIAGRAVDPAEIDLPALVAVPAADRIVPPASARALARELPRAELLRPPSGHIGMVVGSRAADGLWAPLADWLGRQAA